MSTTGRYVYAVTRGVDASVLAGQPGLDDGPLGVVEHAGLVAVVSTVDLEEYGEEGLKRNLERLDWLERTARGHDAVVKAVFAVGPTAPLRLATICLDDEGVRRRLDEWGPALAAVLDRVTDRMEWSVKSFAAPREVPRAAPPAPVGAGGGAAYLRAKKAAAESRHADESEALAVADEVHAALSARAVAGRRLPPQDPRLTGHEGTMVLNAAYLVEEAEGADFAAAAEALAAAHPEARLTWAGPWPPYSFAMLEQP